MGTLGYAFYKPSFPRKISLYENVTARHLTLKMTSDDKFQIYFAYPFHYCT